MGLRAHNKIFSKLFEILVFITCLKDTKIFFLAFKQYQYQRSSGDGFLPSELILPGAHGAWPDGGKYEVDQRPPSSEKPAMAYTSSENWQKYDNHCVIM